MSGGASDGAARVVVVFGGGGALGRAVVKAFGDAKWRVVSVDFAANDDAAQNVAIKGEPEADAKAVLAGLGDARADAVVSVAGGWSGGGIGDDGVFASTAKMLSFNVNSALTAAHVAAKVLKPDADALLVLTGALAALDATPGMIGYGMSKAATHHLLKSISAPNGGLPSGARAVAVAPVTLDTPNNRKGMPKADFSTWTPCDELAAKLLEWAANAAAAAPPPGSIVAVKTAAGATTYDVV